MKKKNGKKMTVEEAGRKGGKATSASHGREFYEAIGRKGGQKVKNLIERGKAQSQNSKSDTEDGGRTSI